MQSITINLIRYQYEYEKLGQYNLILQIKFFYFQCLGGKSPQAIQPGFYVEKNCLFKVRYFYKFKKWKEKFLVKKRFQIR